MDSSVSFVNFLDLLGLEPGDIFPTRVEARHDAAKTGKAKTLATGHEHGGNIFPHPNGEGFTYDQKTDGKPGSVDLSPVPGTVEQYHCHPKPTLGEILAALKAPYGEFHNDDMATVRATKGDDGKPIPHTLVTSKGEMIYYDPNIGKPPMSVGSVK